MANNIKIVEYSSWAMFFALLLFMALSISGSGNSLIAYWQAVGVQMIFFLTSAIFLHLYAKSALGINTNKVGSSLLWGIIIGIFYVIVITLIPGLAIAVPLVPNSISSTLSFIVIVFIAPIGETFFFLGVLVAFISGFNLKGTRLVLAILIQAAIFALFHLGAYIAGFYNLSFTQGLFSFTSNFSVFLAAFIYGSFSGFLAYSKRFKTLLIAVLVHLIINISQYSKLAIFGGFG